MTPPSYAYITPVMKITDQGIDHEINIEEGSVYLDHFLIVRAPDKFTHAKKDRFCRAVIHSLFDERDNLRDHLDRIADLKIKVDEARADPEPEPERIPSPSPARVKKVREWIPDIIIPDPVHGPERIPSPARPGWIAYLNLSITEEGITA